MRVLDPLMLVLAAWLAYTLYLGDSGFEFASYRPAVLLVVLLAVIIFPPAGMYRTWRGSQMLAELRIVTCAWGAVLLGAMVLAVVTKTNAEYSRVWFGLWGITAWFSLIFYRLGLRLLLFMARGLGWYQRRIVVIGSGESVQVVIDNLMQAPWAGYRIEAVFGGDDLLESIAHWQINQIGGYEGVPAFLEQHSVDVDQVWIALSLSEEERLKKVLHDLRHCTADIRYVPDIFGFKLLNHSVSEVAGMPVLNLSVTPMDGVNRLVKAIEDRLLAATILLIIAPLMMALALLVKCSSPGPIFYRQERMGWNGKTFYMLKFRSMPIDAEQNSGAVWAKSGDQRATPLGHFLRRTSLDELPQFINVLKGDMSIVGPRPERPIFVDQFKEEIPDYMKKHLVKAGITGWAQINGWRGNTDLQKRIECDLYYIENWSLWFDIKIIVMTIFRGFVHKNAY
ncbi:MAG: undecaprenyl-phosphate glucose phosphotransferase [Gammaproteobacteria bacterium]|nr:undecaprenyl-phosphate glucose phosphotransferase [Gammaproteobacteria bacterium]